MPRPESPCGTLAAYKRHLRRSETPCEPCRIAKRDAQRDARATEPHEPVMPPPGVDDLTLIVDTLRGAFLTVAENEPEKVAPLAREFRAAVLAAADPAGAPKELTLAEQLVEARAARAARAAG